MLILSVLVTVLPAAAADAKTGSKTLYVQVILGCDKDKPANSNYREVGPKLAAKLSPVFRWKHFWEVEQKKVELDPAKISKVALPGDRTLEIQRLKSGEVEVRLLRKSGLITKSRQSPSSGMAILGGEESSKDSFFVVVRPDLPVTRE